MSETGLPEYLQMLNSTDPSERRSAVEDLMQQEIDENTVKVLCNMLTDQDKGVRDSVSTTLIFNGNPGIPHFVVPYVSSADISVRNLAGEILLRIGEASVEDMINYIDAGNDDDKKFVIDLLGLIGSDAPVEKIIKVLRTNSNENVVLACIEALGNIAYAGALPVLKEFYEMNELYRPTVIEALGKMSSQDTLDFIMSKYNCEDELTKFSIIESLGETGNESTFFFLLSELSKLKGPLVWPVISSLQSLKEKFGLEIPYDESTKNTILYTLLEGDVKYKRAAAGLITVFDDKDTMDAFLKIYGEDAEIDENIKSAFFQFHGTIYTKLAGIIKQNPRNLKYLLWLLKELADFDGLESLNGLSQLDKRNLCDAFTMCLDNPDEEIRKSSAELLFCTSVETAVVFIDSMVEDDNIWNRLKILELIENVYDPKVNEVLKKLAGDPEEMIRDRAVWILSQRGITNFEIKAERI